MRGRLISRNGNRIKRFEGVLDLLPKGHVFDGELVVLDDAGRPLFKELLGHRRPTYVAFDLLIRRLRSLGELWSGPVRPIFYRG